MGVLVAVTVSVFLLAGRYAEARATHSSAAALRALLDLGARDVAASRSMHTHEMNPTLM